MKLEITGGRLKFRYPGQCNDQPVCCDIMMNGTVNIFANGEIGNAVPMKVWHGVIRRLTLKNVSNREEARQWYRENRLTLARLIAGMGEKWNGSNLVGTLTQDAQDALDDLEYKVANQ
jgi:hypothetical protein